MANSTRTWVKRKCDMAKGNLEVAQSHLVEAGIKYEKLHPDYYDKFCSIVQAIDAIAKTVKQLGDTI